MKTLRKNAYKVVVVPFLAKENIVDEFGYENGEYKLTYKTPIEVYASISTSKGIISSETFGSDINYDKALIFNDSNLDITENDILFLDKEPIYDEETLELKNTDYIIKKISKSKNVLNIAVVKVD